jgi:hypothetical protein
MSLISIGRSARSLLGPEPAVHVIRDVITKQQEQNLVDELIPVLKRRRYQRDHWDQVIVGYKEVERAYWQNPDNEEVIGCIRRKIESVVVNSPNIMNKMGYHDLKIAKDKLLMEWLPVHIIDLEDNGFISPHVDSVKFSGGLVCGLSLLSPSIMTLTLPDKNYAADDGTEESRGDGGGGGEYTRTHAGYSKSKDGVDPDKDGAKSLVMDEQVFDESIHLFLPPRSLYILSGPARYNFAHSVDIRTSADIEASFKQQNNNNNDNNNDNSSSVARNHNDDVEKLDEEFVKVIESGVLGRSRRISMIFRDAKLNIV